VKTLYETIKQKMKLSVSVFFLLKQNFFRRKSSTKAQWIIKSNHINNCKKKSPRFIHPLQEASSTLWPMACGHVEDQSGRSGFRVTSKLEH